MSHGIRDLHPPICTCKIPAHGGTHCRASAASLFPGAEPSWALQGIELYPLSPLYPSHDNQKCPQVITSAPRGQNQQETPICDAPPGLHSGQYPPSQTPPLTSEWHFPVLFKEKYSAPKTIPGPEAVTSPHWSSTEGSRRP